ncbi:helix-turn-helix transcriptional regulator [bacterium]|nr:helix-turn-helix transcriptional regulator [bacterium]
MATVTKKKTGTIMPDSQARLCQRIAQIAASVGSVSELARRAGLPIRTVSSYTSGRSVPNAIALADIARAGNVSIEWLATGKKSGDEPALTIGEVERAVRDTFEILDFYGIELRGDTLADAIIEVCRIALAEGWYREGGARPKSAIRRAATEIIERFAA